MATSKINNPHVPGSVLAESTGNKTITQHLSALYSTYNALSVEEKQKTSIVAGSNVYRFTNGNANVFVCIIGQASTLTVIIVRLSSSSTLKSWDITTSGNTVTDNSSDIYNGTMQLVYGI